VTAVAVSVVDTASLAIHSSITSVGADTATAANIRQGALASASASDTVIFPYTRSTSAGIWSFNSNLIASGLTAMQAGNYYYELVSPAFSGGASRATITQTGIAAFNGTSTITSTGSPGTTSSTSTGTTATGAAATGAAATGAAIGSGASGSTSTTGGTGTITGGSTGNTGAIAQGANATTSTSNGTGTITGGSTGSTGPIAQGANASASTSNGVGTIAPR
jgi:hypothetical protein